MLLRTHVVITLFFVLLFIPLVEFKTIFVIIALLATLMPDADIKSSSIGKFKILRPLQIFVKHRGFFHSLTFMFLIILLLAYVYPVGAFAFFVGYGSHLLADSFTKEGIRFFYPSLKRSSGWITTGGRTETITLVMFVIFDVALFLIRIF